MIDRMLERLVALHRVGNSAVFSLGGQECQDIAGAAPILREKASKVFIYETRPDLPFRTSPNPLPVIQSYEDYIQDKIGSLLDGNLVLRLEDIKEALEILIPGAVLGMDVTLSLDSKNLGTLNGFRDKWARRSYNILKNLNSVSVLLNTDEIRHPGAAEKFLESLAPNHDIVDKQWLSCRTGRKYQRLITTAILRP